MSMNEYLNHKCLLNQNIFDCPQNCGTKLKNITEGEVHFENCKNSNVSCLLCFSQVKRSKIDDNLF